MITWFLLIFIAFVVAMLCRSLVHTLLHHYKAFVGKFKNLDEQWWNPKISYLNKEKTITQISDAFHLFNTIELGAYDFIASVLITLALGLVWWWGLIIFAIIAVVMIVVFNLGYDKIWI